MLLRPAVEEGLRREMGLALHLGRSFGLFSDRRWEQNWSLSQSSLGYIRTIPTLPSLVSWSTPENSRISFYFQASNLSLIASVVSCPRQGPPVGLQAFKTAKWWHLSAHG